MNYLLVIFSPIKPIYRGWKVKELTPSLQGLKRRIDPILLGSSTGGKNS